MANMYNYKKPANYHNIKQAMKPMEPVAVAAKQPKNSGDAYLEQRVLSARPEELTLMLYDGILKFLGQAKLFIVQNNVEKSSNSLIRAPEGKLVVVKDIDDYIIVDTADVLLIYPKSKEQEIKQVTALVKSRTGEHFL